MNHKLFSIKAIDGKAYILIAISVRREKDRIIIEETWEEEMTYRHKINNLNKTICTKRCTKKQKPVSIPEEGRILTQL